MIFIGGTGQKMVEIGNVERGCCPHCKSGAPMLLTHSFSYAHAFYIPVFRFDHHYFLACSRCGMTYELPESLGKALAKDLTVPIDPYCLLPVGRRSLHGDPKFPPRYCPQCGTTVSPDDRFCTACGTPLK